VGQGKKLDFAPSPTASHSNSPEAMKRLRDYDEKGVMPPAVQKRLKEQPDDRG
jgi:hypothetical protein